MRVLIAHNRYRIPGGEERHVELLEEGLRAAGIEVRRFERNSDELTGSLPKRAAAVVGLAYRPGGGGIASALDAWRPDVVHFHNIWPLLTPSAMRIARNHGAAVVATFHNYRFACPGGTCPSREQTSRRRLDTDCIQGSPMICAIRHRPRDSIFESYAYGLAIEAQRRLRLVNRWADAFIAPSEFVSHMVRLAGFEAEVRVVPHGLPVSDARPTEGRYGLFFGRLTAAKGVKTLLAASRIASDVPLWIAGEGPLEEVVRKAQVTYVGRLDRVSMSKTIAGSTFVVLASEWHESFGYSALEALMAAKPVIATRVGAMPEVVIDGETGILVPPFSPEELALAMRTLWRDRSLAVHLGTSAHRIGSERFSLSKQICGTIAVYQDAIARRGSTRLARSRQA
jgi:glycosyltransferase involved in cell wall biosynthesis